MDENPQHFCPSRFSQVCPDFHFLQIANLDTHTYVSRFTIDLPFLNENRNLNTLEKI